MAESNATILAAASLVGTSDYQQFMNNLSQQTTDQVVNTLWDPMNRMYKNQFVDFLIQRIGFTWVKKHAFENPLAVFKKSRLMYGSTVQMLALDYIKTREYSDDEPAITETGDSLFKTYRPNGKAAYVSVNQRRQYPITVNDVELRQAFASDTGLNDFVSQVMRRPYDSDNYAEYRAMANSFAEFNKANPGLVYHHKAYTQAPETQDQARAFLVDLKAYADYMRFPNMVRQFTPGDVPGAYSPNELVLLVTPRVNAVLDVEGLATLFHIERGEVPYRTVVVDDFGIPGCFAALCSQDTLLAMDQVYENGSFYNPRTLSTNYFLTHFQIAGIVDPFEPLVLFGYGDGWASTTEKIVTQTTSGITLTAAKSTIKAGEQVKITPTLQGSLSANEGDVPETLAVMPNAATYEVTAKRGTNDVTLNSRTYVDVKTNILHTQKTLKSGDVLTITGTGTYTNPTSNEESTPYTATCTVTIE